MPSSWDPIAVPHRTLKAGMTGRDVRGLKRHLIAFADTHPRLGVPKMIADGTMGDNAMEAGALVVWLLGVGNNPEAASLSPYAQALVRSPGLRNPTQRKRALQRQAQRRKHLARPKVPAAPGGWHPDATRVPYSGAGTFTVGRPKLVWHTTESAGLPSYGGSAPHITFDPKTGRIWQHYPLGVAARALMHPAGTPETNNAHAIQVELLAYSDASLARRNGHSERAVENLTAADYARIGQLARWIEKHAGVPRKCSVTFKVGASRLSGTAFVAYSGHIGHEHTPNNDHWDPAGLRIDLVLK